MSILTGKQVLKPYIKKATGYIKSLLSSQHVEMDNGKTLQSAVDEINNNLTHYIVEQGSNSNGNYRKWSDGTLEMWGINHFDNISINNKWGTLYNSIMQFINLPVISTSDLKGIAGTFTSNSGAWASYGNSNERLAFWIIAPALVTVTGYIRWHCFGTWK